MQNIILGAGFTGMSAAIKTGYPIYEASNKAGGICRSYKKDGFEFSTGGGHWIFGKGPGLDFIKSQVSLNEYERRAGVYYNHTFPYPIQTTAKSPCMAQNGSLKHWLIDTFGPDQFNLFFGPFNEKYTAGLYDTIVQDDEYKSPPPQGKGFCPTFHDPVGGLSKLVDVMERQCGIMYNHRAESVDVHNRIVKFSNGEMFKYDKLISTIPLDEMLKMCGRESNLPYTSVLVLNIGADKTEYTPSQHWMYVPFCKSGFYRVGFYSNISSDKAPEGKVSLSVEMALNHFLNTQELEEITFKIIKELQEWNWIGKVITTDPTFVKCAYTWLYKKGDAQKEIEWLKMQGIHSIGRYGKWKFQGMVEGIADGLGVIA